MKSLSTKMLFITLFLSAVAPFVIQANFQNAAKMASNKKNPLCQRTLVRVVDEFTGGWKTYGYEEGLEKIKSLGDINMRGPGGMTTLMEASYNGCEKIVDFLLAQGADVHIRDDIGRTALIEASQNGHLNIVKSLIENNADVNTVTKKGDTALMGASRRGHVKLVKLLLANNADVYKKHFSSRRTALTEALIGCSGVSADCSSKIVKLLKSVQKREKPCWLLLFDLFCGPYNIEE